MTTQNENSKLLDEEILAQLFSSSLPNERGKFLQEVIELFLPLTQKMLSDIGVAFSKRDHQAIAKIAHSLKSSSYNVGALKLADQCKILEGEALQGLFSSSVNLEQLKDIFEKSKIELQKVCKVCENFTNEEDLKRYVLEFSSSDVTR